MLKVFLSFNAEGFCMFLCMYAKNILNIARAACLNKDHVFTENEKEDTVCRQASLDNGKNIPGDQHEQPYPDPAGQICLLFCFQHYATACVQLEHCWGHNQVLGF